MSLSARNLPSLGRPVALAVSISLLLFGISCDGNSRKIRWFETSLGKLPKSSQVIAVGSDRDIFGRGTAIIIFEASLEDITSIIERNGYSAVSFADNTNQWRPSLCAEVTRKIIGTEVWITPAFTTFDKSTKTNESRIFYNTNNGLAVCITDGRLAK